MLTILCSLKVKLNLLGSSVVLTNKTGLEITLLVCV